MLRLGIVGAKNSGKTTLIEQLLPILNDLGLRCATVKHTAHDHTFDTKGKDSWRHRKAGAAITIAVSRSEVALYTEPKSNIVERLQQLIESDYDVCLVEGDKSSDIPKLLLTRNSEQIDIQRIENIIVTYGPTPLNEDTEHIPLDNVAAVAKFIDTLVKSDVAVGGVGSE